MNIKTPVFQIECPNDPDTADIYTFLKNAAEDFKNQYTEADVTVHIFQFEGLRRDEEISGSFDTPNAADVLWGDISSYIYTGRQMPLDDIITDEIRADIDERFWADAHVEGRTYMLPFFSSQMVLCYNKDLFRQAGLEQYITEDDVIQSWLPEQWEEVLSTLRANLPDTVYPMMMYAATFEGDMHIMTLLRACGSPFFDENARFDLETPEGIAAMRLIRDGYEKGYFPPNAENLEMLDCYDLFMNRQLAIYCVNSALQILFDKGGINYGFVNFPSADGVGFNTTTVQGFEVFDNGDPVRAQVAKDFVQYIYETHWLEYSSGAIPASNRVTEKYKSELQDLHKYINNTSVNNQYTGHNPNWNGVREVFHLHIQDLLYGEKSVEQIAKELDEDCNAAIDVGYQNRKLHQ